MQGSQMSRFMVKFMKVVLGNNGKEQEVCQSCIDVDALDRGSAIVSAKQQFCQTEDLADWSLHADRIQVQEADFPS
jgi:hypothetical protein